MAPNSTSTAQFTLAPLDAGAPADPESGTAIFVYARRTLMLACTGPVRISAFPPGRQADVYLDAGTHERAFEPGVYRSHPGLCAIGGGGDAVDIVRIVGGRPVRRTPRRLFQVMPHLRRRQVARFLRRPAPAPRPPRVIRRVLVVDADPAATSRYAHGFGPGRTVRAASDAASARLLARAAPYDLAIVELRLGDASGIELGRELKRAQPGLAVALCSRYLSIESAVAALRAGLDAVVFKPATAREILRRVGADADAAPGREAAPLALAEEEHISRVLADCGGNISLAATRLGIYRSSLQRRLRRTRARGTRPPAVT